MVAEDTLNIDDGGEPEQVIVTNEVLIDSNWIKVDSVFAIWDTYNIDPYRKNPNELKDTISLQLYASNHPWAFPLNRCHLTSPFGYRWYRLHPGTDLALNTGDSVKAAFDGVVRVVRWDGYGYGYFIVLRHYNGLETLYGHLSKQLVVPHQYVKAGDLIGWGGSTGRSSGPHLHYETRYRGDTFNPGYIYDFAKNGNIKSESLQLTKNNFSYSFQRPAAAQRGYGYPTRSAVYHLLKNGETLGHLAAKYRTSVAYICRLNGISPRTLIRAGRYIRVR
ncbi:MAG: peptidoglycan DD-metalloendopeptidase family protein [Verrucomicrobia bacterium]|nr:peptidoglycan DD-metalloendopeptidase family protein [Cytophagales bacterium]